MAYPSIAVVVFDDLRKDVFDRRFSWLNDIAVSYENAWTTGRWTIPAHASLFSGEYPGAVGTHAKDHDFDPEPPALAEVLSSEGYQTRAVVANPNLDGQKGYDRGFDEFRLLGRGLFDRHIENDHSAPWRYAAFVRNVLSSESNSLKTLASAIKYKLGRLDSSARRVHEVVSEMEFGDREFLFLNFMDTHSPFEAPESYRSVPPATLHSMGATALGDPDEAPHHIRQAYADCAMHLSDLYREMHDSLRQNFDLIFTLSDHGEAFGEHGAWGHSAIPTPEIGQIPFVVSGAKSEVFQTTESPVSILDVFPTVCEWIGEESDRSGPGIPLQNTIPTDRHVFVETFGLSGYEELYLDREKDVGDISKYDRPRIGVATREGYGFETVGHEIETVGEIKGAHSKIDVAYENLDRKARSGDFAVRDGLEGRLQRLGYL